MKLTKPQIQKLYKFTQAHYVDWYDVQTELVDHLANGIEDQWQENPNLNFEAALQTEFKKFGIMGFSDVIAEKTKALNKRYRKLVWKYFYEFFKLPKIIITVFLIWIYYLGLENLENRFILVVPTVVLLFATAIIFLTKSVKAIKLKQKNTNKKWLFDNTILQLGGLVHFLNIGLYAPTFFDLNGIWSSTFQFIFSIIIILYGLALYVSVVIVSPKLRNTIAKQHPDYKFV